MANGALSRCEFEIMEEVWKLGSASVRQVHGLLAARRRVAYTTVMTVMERLVRKGVLERRKAPRGKAYLYRAVIARDRAVAQYLQDAIDILFHGSRAEFISYLAAAYALDLEFQPEMPRVKTNALSTELL